VNRDLQKVCPSCPDGIMAVGAGKKVSMSMYLFPIGVTAFLVVLAMVIVVFKANYARVVSEVGDRSACSPSLATRLPTTMMTRGRRTRTRDDYRRRASRGSFAEARG
jgi:hypothetical protein